MKDAKLEPKTQGLRYKLNHCSLIYCHLLAETVTNVGWSVPLSHRRLYPVCAVGDEGEYQHFPLLSRCVGHCSWVLHAPVSPLVLKWKL